MAEVQEENQLFEELEALKKEHSYRPTYRTILANKGLLVKQTLGSGSYSKVKFAYNLRNRNKCEKVAVKILDRDKAPKDFQVRFFPREISIWPQLKHQHIITLYELFEDSQRTYMVLEFGERGDVLKHVQAMGAINEEQSLDWFRQITSAVKYLHDKNVAHRDLKLENLMLDKDFNIKIGDFGFVRDNGNRELCQTFCGSKSYASPEIIKGQPYSPMKADIWAIGVVLYIIVTGQMPFDETKSSRKLLEEQTKLAFPWQKVSMACRSLILSMFTFNFVERPDIQEVIAHPCLQGTYYEEFSGTAELQNFDSRHTI